MVVVVLHCVGTTTGVCGGVGGVVEEVLYLVEGMFFPAVFDFDGCVCQARF